MEDSFKHLFNPVILINLPRYLVRPSSELREVAQTMTTMTLMLSDTEELHLMRIIQ